MTVGEKIENIVGKSGIKLSNTDCIVLAFTREEWFKKWNQEKFMQEASSCPLCERSLQALLPVTPQEPRWIPVNERLPEEMFGCLVTVWDANPKTGEEFENILPEFVGYDGETWNGADGKPIAFEVIAWMPLPQPYKEDIREVEE